MKNLFLFLCFFLPLLLFAIEIEEISVTQDPIPITQENAGVASEINVEKLEGEVKKEEISIDTFKSQSVKQLKQFLKERNLECKGCSEKQDYVNLAYENRNAPLKADQDQKEARAQANEIPPEVDREKLEELMAKLRNNGFGNNQFFSSDDLRNLNPEELKAKMEGKSKPKPKKDTKAKKKKEKTTKAKDSSSKKKPEPKRPKVVEEEILDGETIEL